jgi:hypothetical protein
VVRRLGKAYFFQFFGDADNDAVPKAQKTLERALVVEKDDPETLAYLGALHIFAARRLHKQDPAKQKAGYDRGFELVKLAEKTWAARRRGDLGRKRQLYRVARLVRDGSARDR